MGLEPRCAGRSAAHRQANPVVGRLRRLPLVPRHGARKLRGRSHRGGDERAVRQHQGRPEERPDIDRYMSALHPGRQGGWPLTMFQTPKGEPVWGGTYFSENSRYGRPVFVDVLREVSRLFSRTVRSPEPRPLMERRTPGPLASHGRCPRTRPAGPANRRVFDLTNGGPGAPKFQSRSELVWRAKYVVATSGFRADRTHGAHLRGGIYDHLGGGFRATRSTSAGCCGFEDALALALPGRQPLFRQRATETVGWLAWMTTPEGAFQRPRRRFGG